MHAQDASRDPGPGELLAYDRATVTRYLEEAEAARHRLEAELAAGQQRLRDLERERSGDGSVELLGIELRDLTGRLDAQRAETWSEVQQVLAQADAEAAAIVAAAHAEAASIRAGRPALQPAFADLHPVAPAELVR